MTHEIPKEILALAKEELDYWKQYQYPHAGELEYLGQRNGIRYYEPYYPDNVIFGYPKVYSINDKGICAVHRTEEAQAICRSLTKIEQKGVPISHRHAFHPINGLL